MKNKGIKLYKEAKKLIPGGTMLYSKKPELYSSNHCLFLKAKNCYVWDIEVKNFWICFF